MFVIIPAGVAHKTFNPKPDAGFTLLTPGKGYNLSSDFRERLSGIRLSGFTIIDSCPRNGEEWDCAGRGEGAVAYAKVLVYSAS